MSDRGDDYFARFDKRLQALLDEQATGAIHMHVLIDDGVIAGRVNLVDAAEGAAELGYRIAQSAAGRGLATEGVQQVCRTAASDYGLVMLRARTTLDNPASQKVLTRTGFVVTAKTVVGGRDGIAYERDLTSSATPST